MANLTSFSALHEKVNLLKERVEGRTFGEAFSMFFLNSILQFNEDEIEECYTDGPMDGQIDAIYVKEKEIHICTFKYTRAVNLTENNFPETDLTQFCDTIDKILSANLKREYVNDAVWEKNIEIIDLFSKVAPKVYIHIASNKQKPVSSAIKKFEDTLKRY